MKHLRYTNILLILIIASGLVFFVSCQKDMKPTDTKSETTEQQANTKADKPVAEKNVAKEPTTEAESNETGEDAEAKGPTYTNLVDGTTFSFDNMKDHVLIIDFWAPWCPPCKAEIPGFIELHNKYKDKKFAVIGIAISTTDDDVKAYIKQAKVNYPIIMGTDELRMQYEAAMGQNITAIPTTFVIDKKGAIASVHVGAEDKSVFEQEILKLF